VPLRYEPSGEGELRQGEILAGVWEHRARHRASAIAEDAPVLDSFLHPLVVVVSPDCDLLKDFSERQRLSGERRLPNLLQHVTLCDLHQAEAIQFPMTLSHKERRVIEQNGNERYHVFPAAPVGDVQGVAHPAFYLDFKSHFTVPTDGIYAAIREGEVWRLGFLPCGYLHDLVHRFYGFLSRVGVEE